jgi:hypothetical protein
VAVPFGTVVVVTAVVGTVVVVDVPVVAAVVVVVVVVVVPVALVVVVVDVPDVGTDVVVVGGFDIGSGSGVVVVVVVVVVVGTGGGGGGGVLATVTVAEILVGKYVDWSEGKNVAVIVAVPRDPNVTWFSAMAATEESEDEYWKVPGTEAVGGLRTSGASPGVALTSGKPLKTGMVRAEPVTDMMKLPGTDDQVDPPSDETNERRLGGGTTSVVGAVALYFQPNVPPVSPLTTTKY